MQPKREKADRSLSLRVPARVHKELRRLAKLENRKLSNYVSTVLKNHVSPEVKE